MSMYRIANAFPEHARQAALRETYINIGPALRRTIIGAFCPLGIMLLVASDGDINVGEPSCCEVRSYLDHGQLNDLTDDDMTCPPGCDDAAAFINAWDDGKITDLAEALGVTRRD